MTRVPDAASADPVTARTWTLGTAPWRGSPPPVPQARVIIDNDFAGDPDDLYQLVHHLLSPGVEVRAVIGSHLREGDWFDPTGESAANAVRIIRDVFARMGLASSDVIHQGAEKALDDRRSPRRSAAVDAIIAEATREDSRPLYFVAGGGLTDLASAYLIEPRIADRMTVIWIGGPEHEGLAVPPPGAMGVEYNLWIDVTAAQVVFDDSKLALWQVPRDVYRQCLVTDIELRQRVAAAGRLGQYLYDEIAFVFELIGAHRGGATESYPLGDSPLVVLTALQSLFEPDPSSSTYVTLPAPGIADDGTYVEIDGARPIRVYTTVDTRLMFEDFFLKLQEFCRWSDAE